MNPLERKQANRVWYAINSSLGKGQRSYFIQSGGAWSIFSRTFGWFQVSQDLTEEQKTHIEERFRKQAEIVFGTRDGVL